MTIASARLSRVPAGQALSWQNWTIFSLLALSALSCSSESPEFEGPYKHVLLISLDTTRADRIGCYGGPVAKTPRIDSLAAGGVLFEDMTAAATSTLSSHTSILTGLYPRRHGVARNGFMVNQENVMLAEVLAANGFHTAGVIGSFALDEMFEINQGFDVWDQEFDIEFDPRTADQNQRRGDHVTDAALALVDQLDGSERLFLFAHYFDVHAPYAPPEPYASEYALPGQPKVSDFSDVEKQVSKHQVKVQGKPRPIYDIGLNRPLVESVDGQMLPGDEAMRALYDGELAFTDQQIGRLLDGLDERGFLKDCIVIITGDHGETFWEHGDFWHHGAWVYQTNVHVPFIVHLPDGRGAGERVAQPVSGVDIFPTLLELLEIPLPEPVAGVSVVQAIDGAGIDPRPIFTGATQPTKLILGDRKIEDRFKWPNQLKPQGLRLGKWKYVQAPYMRFEELFDLETDPEERHNLLDNERFGPSSGLAVLSEPTQESALILKRMRAEFKQWLAQLDPRESHFNKAQMADVLRRLRNLGYVGDEVEEESVGDGHGH